MKKSILLIGVFICLSIAGNAQSPVAKIKYEEAEQAYTDKDYSTAIDKLNEAERLLGSSNPKTQYLRIMINDKQLEAQLFKDLEMAAQLTSSCADFMAKNETVQALEDKYMEVYKVAEKIKPYNLTTKDFADAKAGKTGAMLKVARAYGYFEDYLNEYKWYKQLADKGNGIGMWCLAFDYQYPKFRQPIQKDEALGKEWERKAELAMTAEEKEFIKGYGNATDAEHRRAAELGNTKSMKIIARQYAFSKDVSERSQGIAWYKKSIEAGNPHAFSDLADVYMWGRGVEKNPKLAKESLQKGVALGNTDCMVELANLIAEENTNEAFNLYLKAADKGNTSAMGRLSIMYMYGNSVVSRDYSKVLQWRVKAASIDPFEAKDVAELYEKGEFVSKDYAKAVEWYSKSYYEGGSHFAAENIAKLYREGGYGIEKSEAKAHEWDAKR